MFFSLLRHPSVIQMFEKGDRIPFIARSYLNDSDVLYVLVSIFEEIVEIVETIYRVLE